MGPWPIVSSDKLEEPGIELETPGYTTAAPMSSRNSLFQWGKKPVLIKCRILHLHSSPKVHFLSYSVMDGLL